MKMSKEREEKIRLGEKKVRFDSKEYYSALAHATKIIYRIARNYVHSRRITFIQDAKTEFEGTTVSWDIIYLTVFVKNEKIGDINIADNFWNRVSERERQQGFLGVFDDEYVEKEAVDLFEYWTERAEQDDCRDITFCRRARKAYKPARDNT